MTYFHIKLLAALLMVIDHVGAVFVQDQPSLRAIGRLSFPLFAWLLTRGERYTKNIWAYLGRLALAALISQPFYSRLFQTDQLNVLVTLALGLIVVRLGKQIPDLYPAFGLLGMAIAFLVPMDGGAYGIGVIMLMAAWSADGTPEEQVRWWVLWVGWHLICILLLQLHNPIQLWAIATPLLLYRMGTQRGPKARWFYGFYPGHLAILLGLWRMSG